MVAGNSCGNGMFTAASLQRSPGQGEIAAHVEGITPGRVVRRHGRHPVETPVAEEVVDVLDLSAALVELLELDLDADRFDGIEGFDRTGDCEQLGALDVDAQNVD